MNQDIFTFQIVEVIGIVLLGLMVEVDYQNEKKLD
jgi:hypothetical protein